MLQLGLGQLPPWTIAPLKISLIILKRNLSCVLKKCIYVYKASYCDKDEMKDNKNFRGGIIVWRQLP